MRIAIFQMNSGIDPQANASAIANAIKDAADDGAIMLFTPEMSGLIDRNRDRAKTHISLEANDLVLAAVRKAAREHGIWVHLGSLALLDETGSEKCVNRGFMIDDRGEVRARYDKMHLFDVDLDTGESWRESSAYVAGAAPRIVDSPAGIVGLSICYDVRFPALYSALSGAGATILTVPAAFTVPTGRAHWHTLLRARAIENACWVIAAAQTGEHADGRRTFGHSLVIDPWGDIILDMADAPGIGFAEIEASHVAEVRRHIPVIAHRRDIPAVEST